MYYPLPVDRLRNSATLARLATRGRYRSRREEGVTVRQRRAWGLNLSRFIFDGQTLFEGCSLRGVDFSNSTFIGARFERCELRGVDFRYADLDGAVFESCLLIDCQFEHAGLRHTTIANSVIVNADLAQAPMLPFSISHLLTGNNQWQNVRFPSNLLAVALAPLGAPGHYVGYLARTLLRVGAISLDRTRVQSLHLELLDQEPLVNLAALNAA